MNTETFVKYLNERLERTVKVLAHKRKEYVYTDNPMQNFEDAVGISIVRTREGVAFSYLVKHIQSAVGIIEFLELHGNVPHDADLIREKFGDIINYFIIIESMLLERLEKQNPGVPVNIGLDDEDSE